MMQELLPGGNIKLFAAVEQVGECQEQTDLVGEGTAIGNPSHGETHGQDGEEPGSEGSAAQEGELTAVDFLHASVAFDDEVVAGVADFPFHIFHRDNVGVIIYQGSSARQGNRGGVDAFERLQFLFNIGRAYAASHAYYRNCFLHYFSFLVSEIQTKTMFGIFFQPAKLHINILIYKIL